MPCIIYHVSYENELKGKFCLLLGAFTSFSNAGKKKKMQKRRVNPCQYSKLESMGRREWGVKGRISDLLFHVCFVEWISL